MHLSLHSQTARKALFNAESGRGARRDKIAEIAQLVERNLAKVEVAGPSPVFRSRRQPE